MSKFVNSNASGKVSIIDIIWLVIGFIVYVRIKRWSNFFKMILIRKRPGVKAAILDMILLEVFVTLQKTQARLFSSVFQRGSPRSTPLHVQFISVQRRIYKSRVVLSFKMGPNINDVGNL